MRVCSIFYFYTTYVLKCFLSFYVLYSCFMDYVMNILFFLEAEVLFGLT